MKKLLFNITSWWVKLMYKTGVVNDYLLLEWPFIMSAKLIKGGTEIKIVKIPPKYQ